MCVVILHGGGVEQYILNVLDQIDHSIFQIEVLLPKGDYDREKELKKRKIEIKKYDCTSLKEKIKNFYIILKENKYDIVHLFTGNEAAMLCLIAKMAGHRKIIVHSHASQSGDENKKFLHLIKKKIIFQIAKIIYWKNALCLACSEEASDFMFGRYNKTVYILRNGIDMKKFRKENTVQKEMSFVINARFEPVKNPYFVIDILFELIKKNPQTTLEWIGSGGMKREIEDYVKELQIENHINFLGTVNDVENVLNRNRFFLLPSLSEGLPIVLIEAQAVGLKCFISSHISKLINCGGCVEISLEKTAKEWAEIILDEIEKGLDIHIEEDKIAKFSVQDTVNQLEKIYKEL